MGVQSSFEPPKFDTPPEHGADISEPIRLLNAAIEIASDAGRGAFAVSLRELRDRLAHGRLQLAVVGQFKRGKSTLLNALIGKDLLPVGVAPVTAIPTFVESGPELEFQVEFKDGRTEIGAPEDIVSLRRSLFGAVTEEGNSENIRGVARARIRTPSQLLGRGVTLIDTPGVGSTLQHNTVAAEMSLPACDAALFVVSADPPITQAELDYLGRVRENASHLLVVLNKADLLLASELEAAESFLRRVLTEQAALDAPEIFVVSARRGLEAKLVEDEIGLRESGLVDLETRLDELIATERDAILEAAVTRKGRSLVKNLAFEISLERRALELPLSDLEVKRSTFAEAIAGFQAERQFVGDLLAADQKRLFEILEEAAIQLRERLAGQVLGEMSSAPDDLAAAWNRIRHGLPGRFQHELEAIIEVVDSTLEATFRKHAARAEALFGLVRRTAAEVMDIPFDGAAELSEFEPQFLPTWVIDRPEALNPLPTGAGERLLPKPMRAAAQRRRIRRELNGVMLRNVEKLRWAMRQNIHDAFRRFGAEMDRLLAANLASTRDVMDAAVNQRRRYELDSSGRLTVLDVAHGRLRQIEGELACLMG